MPEDFTEVSLDHHDMTHVFEIAYLDMRQAAMFNSDFRYIAEYLVQTRIISEKRREIEKKYGKDHQLTAEEKEGLKYQPMKGEIRHLETLSDVMTAITGDNSFAKNARKAQKRKEVYRMEDIWTIASSQGRDEGIKIGEDRGIKIGQDQGIEIGKIEIYYNEMHLTPSEIAKKLGKPKELVEKIIQQFTK